MHFAIATQYMPQHLLNHIHIKLKYFCGALGAIPGPYPILSLPFHLSSIMLVLDTAHCTNI